MSLLKKLHITVQVALVTGLFTAAATWMQNHSAELTVKKEKQIACVKRVDEREDKLRLRAETFLTAMSKAMAYPYYPKPNGEELAVRYESSVVAAQALIANAPPRLAAATMRLTGKYIQAVNPTSNEAENAKNLQDYASEVIPWHNFYFEHLMLFDQARQDC